MGLIVPEKYATRTPVDRRADLITVGEVLDLVGPLAVAFEEMKAKVATLEDRLGITDANPQGMIDSGSDVEYARPDAFSFCPTEGE